MNDSKDDALKELTTEGEAEVAVTTVIKSKIADLRLRTVAEVQARYEAYGKIYDKYQGFLINEAEKLYNGEYSGNTYKELGMARLIAQWTIETEKFAEIESEKLQGVERETRKDFVKEALRALPDEIKNELLGKLNDKKQEVLEWFAKELQVAQRKANERRRRDVHKEGADE